MRASRTHHHLPRTPARQATPQEHRVGQYSEKTHSSIETFSALSIQAHDRASETYSSLSETFELMVNQPYCNVLKFAHCICPVPLKFMLANKVKLVTLN